MSLFFFLILHKNFINPHNIVVTINAHKKMGLVEAK